MAGSLIQPWLKVYSCPRITTLGGHLRVRQTAGPGAWQDVTIDDGLYRNFDAAAALEDALDTQVAGAPFLDWDVDVLTGISNANVQFDVEFLWPDVAEYFGFQAGEVVTSEDLTVAHGAYYATPPEFPGGVYLSNRTIDIEYSIRLPHRHTQATTATERSGSSFDIVHGQTIRWIVSSIASSSRALVPTEFSTPDEPEVKWLIKVLKRMMRGAPADVAIDDTMSTSDFDWTNADWTSARAMALADPAATANLVQWLATDNSLYRTVELRLVEVSNGVS